jgi:hypothetical protein
MLTAPLSALHTVRFELVTFGRNEFVAHCTCGWSHRGTKADTYNRAAVHDLDQWPLTDDELHTSL